MKNLGIAFYTDTYLPATDGVVSSILNFRKELERRGHRVYVFSSFKIGSERMKARNVFLYPGLDFKPYPQYSLALFPYNSTTELKKHRIDLIHAHTPMVMGFAGLVSAKLGKYPLVGSYHTMVDNKAVIRDYYPKNRQLRRFTSKYIRRYIQFFYKRCNATTVPSKVVAEMLGRYAGIGNIFVVPNSIDLKVFNTKVSGTQTRKFLNIGGREKVVLYLGRLSREKKIEVMLKAAAAMAKNNNSARFLIGGTGPAEAYYKALAKRLGLQKSVRFLGYVERKALPGLYAASDLLCLPSTFETQGIVSLEAMATGKPVVGANYLALAELIKDGKNGEKFMPGDYLGCARKIGKVLNNPSLYIRETVNTAKEFSVENATNKLLEVYDLVLSTATNNGGFTERQW